LTCSSTVHERRLAAWSKAPGGHCFAFATLKVIWCFRWCSLSVSARGVGHFTSAARKISLVAARVQEAGVSRSGVADLLLKNGVNLPDAIGLVEQLEPAPPPPTCKVGRNLAAEPQSFPKSPPSIGSFRVFVWVVPARAKTWLPGSIARRKSITRRPLPHRGALYRCADCLAVLG